MHTVKIMIDLWYGPIWKDTVIDGNGTLGTGIPIIDEDEQLQKLNDEISNLYVSYIDIDENGVPQGFNEAQEKADKQKMLELLAKLNARLAEINDGSFTVEDLETPRVQAL